MACFEYLESKKSRLQYWREQNYTTDDYKHYQTQGGRPGPRRKPTLQDEFFNDAYSSYSRIICLADTDAAECSSQKPKPWENSALGWIENPTRQTGIFYNTVMPGFYSSYWPYYPDIQQLRKAFIVERARHYNNWIKNKSKKSCVNLCGQKRRQSQEQKKKNNEYKTEFAQNTKWSMCGDAFTPEEGIPQITDLPLPLSDLPRKNLLQSLKTLLKAGCLRGKALEDAELFLEQEEL
ncbi:unnamed protein product [Mytilus edulis]|uniref:Uncharacterized protein n=1 Tax=Mytilus edulis TaxID=6550 RepID=A0A8S3TUW6_MYTED|nr:unnamed protein product [Mytilus edulis]